MPLALGLRLWALGFLTTFAFRNSNYLQMLDVNTAAPEFQLQATPDQKFSLSELRGRNVILTFYPA
ncbi:MAG TPA: hypothetical protein VFE04_04455, partial [Puia sp.]|nr:hypothetical protein [Puia sp.]